MKTKITELLGIEYPIIQGGMAWVAEHNLAAAVSNAGGLGIIGAASAPPEIVREEIRNLCFYRKICNFGNLSGDHTVCSNIVAAGKRNTDTETVFHIIILGDVQRGFRKKIMKILFIKTIVVVCMARFLQKFQIQIQYRITENSAGQIQDQNEFLFIDR